MFQTQTHDFGVVARSAKKEFAFEFENSYVREVHISGVRTSCGCTTPRIAKPTLATYEKGAIIAAFNTDRFLGRHGATLTVTFDKPSYAEVQLTVTGFIRSDVVIEPGSLSFGAVGQGGAAETSARIQYHGNRNDWRVLDVRGNNQHVQAELKSSQDGLGRAAYTLVARLKPTAPAGFLRDEWTLITNDPEAPQLPVLVEGQVMAPITLSPNCLFFGVIPPGQQVEKKLIVRSEQPCKIISVASDDDQFEFELDDSVKTLHIVPVKFTAGPHPGKVVGTINVRTDLGDGATAQCTASAAIVESVETIAAK